MQKYGFYPGSFDPPTNGHEEIIRSSFEIMDGLVIGIGENSTKKPIFSVEDRMLFMQSIAAPLSKGKFLKIISFNNLTVKAARENEASFIIRGLRNASDFEYEMQLSDMNTALYPEIKTIFLTTHISSRYISSTLVRQIANMNGDVFHFVPEIVRKALAKHASK